MAKVTDTVAALALPYVEAAGCTLWDVEYVKEAGEWFLRVYIDKEGGVSIDDCEAVSRPLSDKLDEVDPIEGSYVLEVGSAGADRVLKKPEHFAAFLGSPVEVRLYRARDGRKEFVGPLEGFDNGDVLLEGGLRFEKKDIAQVRLHVTF
jgi:ribosome maturation factor RimP